MTTVSFIMPVRNEEEYIRVSLQSLVDQSYPAGECEIIVVDGRSSDRTREIIEEIREKNPQVLCLDNPAGIVPTAMNIGIRAARGEVIIRADGHNIYPADYTANCVKCLLKTGADNVGGPWLTVPADKSFGATLVAAILSSPFGVGNSKFRTSREEGFVDTVPFGAFRKAIFDRVGMYNEQLVRNQDNELNARIRSAGGKIYLTPAMFLMFLVVLLLASFASGIALVLLSAVIGTYLAIGFCFSLGKKAEDHRVALAQPFASLLFHVVYGAGTLLGFIYIFRRPSNKPIRPGLSILEKEK